MAIIKCKMCGGDLNVTEGVTVAECEYCGTKQTVPNVDSEKKLILFSRANRLRLAGEFDKAAGVYESIVAEFPEEAEAYWGLVLCKYGIEYVDDPTTGKKVPTCHRSSFNSILKDSDFEQACENADTVARKVYREEAKAIEDIRKGILEVSGKEPPYDIFICYKETDENGERTVDSVLAQDVYDALTEKGYRVFFSRITLEDKLGAEYEPYIFAALNSAKIMLVFGTDYEYFNAVWVKNEWSRYLKLMAQDKSKHLIPCYRDVDAYDMPEEFQKLQGQDMGKVGAVQDLLRGIEKLLGKDAAAQTDSTSPAQAAGGPTVESLMKRGQLFLESGDWDSANEYFDKVLDIAPESAEAYVGKYCAERKYRDFSFMRLDHGDQLYAKGILHLWNLTQKKEFDRAKTFYQDVTGADQTGAQQFLGMLLGMEKLDISAVIPDPTATSRNFTLALRFASPELRTQLEEARDAFRQNREKHIQEVEREIADAEQAERDAAEEQKRAKEQKKIQEAEEKKAHAELLRTRRELARRFSKRIAAGAGFVVALKLDGTPLVAGASRFGAADLSGWKDLTAVSAGLYHTVGLRSNGTVVATKYTKKEKYNPSNDSFCQVSHWRNIVDISAATTSTVGIKADGTAVWTGQDLPYAGDLPDAGNWKDFVDFAATRIPTIDDKTGTLIGLKSDGTVVDSGYFSQKYPVMWNAGLTLAFKNVAMSASTYHAVFLKENGLVLPIGDSSSAACQVRDWQDIVQVCATGDSSVTYGLKADGTMVATKDPSPYVHEEREVLKWKDIIAFSANGGWVVGLKSDGTLVSTSEQLQEMIGSWKLFDSLDTIEQELAEVQAKRKAALEKERDDLQAELPNLKGFFSGGKRREMEARIAEIEEELKKL